MVPTELDEGQSPAEVPIFSPALKRWILMGMAGWTAVALIWAVDVAFQLRRLGDPTWWALPITFAGILPGVALTPLVFLAFRRVVASAPVVRVRAARYGAIGITYWLLWSIGAVVLMRSGVLPGEAEDVSVGLDLYRRVAGNAFNSLLLFSVMAMLHEAVRHAGEARRQEIRTARLETELAGARMAALDAQLNPHFLFNTLHMASGLMNDDVERARDVLADLRQLLQGSLAEGGEQLVPLRDELRLAERYTDIQKARFRDRLQVEFRIDPDVEHLPVPPLLLQPLLENAVRHGVGEEEEGGWIRVTAASTGAGVRLAVTDSGRGLPGRAVSPARERVGLGGTRARLRLLFGERASLGFSYPVEGGFRVDVLLPAIQGTGV